MQAGDTFQGWSKEAEGKLEHRVALLHIRANLLDIAGSVPGDAHTQQSLAAARGEQKAAFACLALAVLLTMFCTELDV